MTGDEVQFLILDEGSIFLAVFIQYHAFLITLSAHLHQNSNTDVHISVKFLSVFACLPLRLILPERNKTNAK